MEEIKKTITWYPFPTEREEQLKLLEKELLFYSDNEIRNSFLFLAPPYGWTDYCFREDDIPIEKWNVEAYGEQSVSDIEYYAFANEVYPKK